MFKFFRIKSFLFIFICQSYCFTMSDNAITNKEIIFLNYTPEGYDPEKTIFVKDILAKAEYIDKKVEAVFSNFSILLVKIINSRFLKYIQQFESVKGYKELDLYPEVLISSDTLFLTGVKNYTLAYLQNEDFKRALFFIQQYLTSDDFKLFNIIENSTSFFGSSKIINKSEIKNLNNYLNLIYYGALFKAKISSDTELFDQFFNNLQISTTNAKLKALMDLIYRSLMARSSSGEQRQRTASDPESLRGQIKELSLSLDSLDTFLQKSYLE